MPQFYLRNFSTDPERKRISLFVLDAARHVPAASIKDQAYKNYCYGKGGAEDSLSELEAAASPVISSAINDGVLPEGGSDMRLALLTFALFQDARTPVRVATINEATEKIVRTVARGFPDLKSSADTITVTDPNASVLALQMTAELCPFALDLCWKLLENRTGRLFLTSDNPTIRYNQFLEKRNTLGSNTGLASKGLQMFLPLGPRYMLMFYDCDVYRVGGRKHLESRTAITCEKDVAALNAVQVANAGDVVFFSPDTAIVHVLEAVASGEKYRGSEKALVTEHPAVGPEGRKGTLMQTSQVDLRMKLALDFCVILSEAAGPQLKEDPVHVRDAHLVRMFEMSRMVSGPCNARNFVDHYRGAGST